MARVRRSGTAPELAVRRAARKLGAWLEPGNADLPGSPDLVDRRRHLALFVHGCFWHRHPGCPHSTTPRRNHPFWLAKFQANVRRDRRVARRLRALGWSVVTVWGCQVRTPPTAAHVLADRLARLVRGRRCRRPPAS